MFAEEDPFLKGNRYSNYGEVASNLKDFLQEMSEKKKTQVNIERLEDMQKALNSMPEVKKEAGNANKHVDIVGDLSKQINIRKLLMVGEVEQTMLAKDQKSDSYKEIVNLMEDAGVKTYDLMRLILLFCVKYEGDSKANELKELLR
jgi:vacuolar protein sorting-associated protein 45